MYGPLIAAEVTEPGGPPLVWDAWARGGEKSPYPFQVVAEAWEGVCYSLPQKMWEAFVEWDTVRYISRYHTGIALFFFLSGMVKWYAKVVLIV